MNARRHWPKIAIIVGSVALVLVAVAPQIVAWTPLRHELPRQRLKGFRGSIRVESASLSWWGPNVLKGLELDSPDGKPFVQVGRITENCGVWGSLFRRHEPLHVVLENPVVNVVARADGSNVEDALAPVLAHPGHEVRQRSSQVAGGKVNFIDATTGQTSELKNVSVETLTTPADHSLNRIVARADEADSPAGGTFEAEITWPDDAAAAAHSEFTLKSTNITLKRAQPLLNRWWSDLDVAGTVTADLHVVLATDSGKRSSSLVSADCTLTCPDLKIASASRIGPGIVAPGPTEFRGRFSHTGGICRVEDLHFKSDFSRIDGGLAIVGDEPSGAKNPAEKSGLRSLPELDLRGEVDLVALSRLIPDVLGIREGVDLQEGRIQFELATRQEDRSPRWTGRLETSRIAATVGGDEIAWDQPLALNFVVRHRETGYEIESIESQSDVVTLRGGATSDGVHLEAGCDLQELLSRLGKFLDTDAVEARGRLASAADFRRDAHTIQVDAQTTVENLILRRQVTRMIERRAGDMQPERVAPPGTPEKPPPTFDPPRNRKEMAAQKRAARQARQQERRQEREERRQANQMVLVPVQEWQTVWSEPKFAVSSQSHVDFRERRIDVAQLDVESDGIQLHAKGNVSEIPQKCVVDLAGDLEYDMARLIERARGFVGPYIQITGRDKRHFSLAGPLRLPATGAPEQRPLVPADLTGQASAGWSEANLFGLRAGPGELDLSLQQATLALRPLEVALGGGKLLLGSRALFSDNPPLLEIPGGPVIEHVALTDQFCESWLKYIAPILSEATRCSGQFSLRVDEAHLPLIDPAAGELTGRLNIERGEVLPGPLFDEINALVGRLVAGAGAGATEDLLGRDNPLVVINPQAVEFELHEKRIHHEAMEFQARGIVIRTRGSVGLDQTLDLVAAIAISDEIADRVRLLASLKGRSLEIPVTGTLRRPRLDPRTLERLAEQLGQNALDKLLNQGLRNLFEKNE